MLYLKDIEEFEKLLDENKGKLIVIDFMATWCGPCQMIAPVLQRLSEEYPNVIFAKVDVDEAEPLAAKCGIKAMPTFQLYKDGTKLEEMKGANPAKLEAAVKQFSA